jgi:transaldolase/glucose-6-phosphate isomerase
MAFIFLENSMKHTEQSKDKQTFIQYSGVNSALVIDELNRWQNENKVQRLWVGDPSLWTNSDENKWIGWLNIAELEQNEILSIETLAKEIKNSGVKHVVVLGMGGSSLCPAMIADTFGTIEDNPTLHVLDSTDPMQIRHLEDTIDLQKAIFIVSSKSGSTLEPNIFKQYFYARLQAVLGQASVGSRFLAITDPGTSLEKIAKEENFKAIFYGVSSIGGRYSALSNFGMVPAGLVGLDIKKFLEQAKEMAQLCSKAVFPKDNPGIILGILLGICAKQQKDKITFIVSPEIQALGAWLEQLLAESTGKTGKGLIPVDLETLGSPTVYGNDRVFVYIKLESSIDNEQDSKVSALERAGFVVIRLHLSEIMQLSAQCFLWEIATAVAGSVIGINPFNQPDVEEAKVRALQLTKEYQQTGKIFQPTPFFSEKEIQLFSDEINTRNICLLVANNTASIEHYIKAHLSRVKPGDYVDLSAFIEMSAENINLLQQSRALIRDKLKVATCLGFGPRFLHSTGQAYKGGPNTGVFLQITTDPLEDLPVPDTNYTFGLVISAQAQADFEVLTKRSRRFLRIHLGKNVKAGLRQLHDIIQQALSDSQSK